MKNANVKKTILSKIPGIITLAVSLLSGVMLIVAFVLEK